MAIMCTKTHSLAKRKAPEGALKHTQKEEITTYVSIVAKSLAFSLPDSDTALPEKFLFCKKFSQIALLSVPLHLRDAC